MSRRRAGAAALQGIASAQLVGVGIVALDEGRQRSRRTSSPSLAGCEGKSLSRLE